MGLNKPVDFTTAKLLKEKGFDEPVHQYYEFIRDLSSKQDKFDEIKPFTQSSPSGDGYGCDNDFIDFSEVCGHNSLDIIELCGELKILKSQF